MRDLCSRVVVSAGLSGVAQLVPRWCLDSTRGVPAVRLLSHLLSVGEAMGRLIISICCCAIQDRVGSLSLV